MHRWQGFESGAVFVAHHWSTWHIHISISIDKASLVADFATQCLGLACVDVVWVLLAVAKNLFHINFLTGVYAIRFVDHTADFFGVDVLSLSVGFCGALE